MYAMHIYTTLQQLSPLQWLLPLPQLVQHYQHKQTQFLQYLLPLPLQWVLLVFQLPHLSLQQKPLWLNQNQNHHEQEQEQEQQAVEQEVKQEVKQEAEQEVKQEVKQEVEQEVKQVQEVEPRVLEAEQELRTQEPQEGHVERRKANL